MTKRAKTPVIFQDEFIFQMTLLYGGKLYTMSTLGQWEWGGERWDIKKYLAAFRDTERRLTPAETRAFLKLHPLPFEVRRERKVITDTERLTWLLKNCHPVISARDGLSSDFVWTRREIDAKIRQIKAAMGEGVKS